MDHSPRRLARLALAGIPIAVLLLAGCSRLPAPLIGTHAQYPKLEAAPQAKRPRTFAERMMPLAKRNAGMPKGLPIEIPVIDGKIVSTSTPTPDWSWMYSVETSASVMETIEWYSEAFESRQWRVASFTQNGTLKRYVLRKASAETVLTIESEPATKGALVRASIGIGRSAPTFQ